MPLAVNALKKKFEMEMRQFVHVGVFPSVNNSSTILVESSTQCAPRVLTKVVRAPDIYGGELLVFLLTLTRVMFKFVTLALLAATP